MIGRSLNADLRKMKGTSVILAHLLIPIITSVIFLIYYFFSPWNENMKVIAFYQAIGAGLPVPVSYTHLRTDGTDQHSFPKGVLVPGYHLQQYQHG